MIGLLIVLLFSHTNAFFTDFNNEMRRDLEEAYKARDSAYCNMFFSFSGSVNPLRIGCENYEEENKSKVETRQTKEYLSQRIDYGVDDTNKTLFYLLHDKEIQQKLSYMQNVLHLDAERINEIRNFIFPGRQGKPESEARQNFLENLFQQSAKKDSSPDTLRKLDNVVANLSNKEEIRHALEEIVEIIHRNTTDNDHSNFNNIDQPISSNITNIFKDDRQVISEWKEKESVRNKEIQEENIELPKSFKDIASKIFKENVRNTDKRENQEDVKKETQEEKPQDSFKNFKSDYSNSPAPKPKYFSSFDDLLPKDDSEAEAFENAQRIIEENQYAQMFMSSIQDNPDMEVQDVFNNADTYNFG